MKQSSRTGFFGEMLDVGRDRRLAWSLVPSPGYTDLLLRRWTVAGAGSPDLPEGQP